MDLSSITFGRWVASTFPPRTTGCTECCPVSRTDSYVISEMVDFQYKCTNYHAPECFD